MASHGKSRHTKRLAAARVLPIKRKSNVWIKTIKPGPHAKESAVQLVVLLRDLLEMCRTAREVKQLVNEGKVSVDGKIVKSVDFQVGLMDVVTLKEGGSFVILNKKGKLLPFKTQVTSTKLCKVIGKHFVKKGKIQLSLHDGKTLLVPNGKLYSTGDTLKMSIPKLSIVEHLKLEKGSKCYVFKGRHAGAVGSLVDIHVFPGITPSNAKLMEENGTEVVTLKNYVFVVDKEFKV